MTVAAVAAQRLRAGRLPRALAAAAALALVGLGLLGAYRYVHGFWLYRGYPPPKEPAFVDRAGTTLKVAVASPALGGRRLPVYVYLPPGYAEQPARRYPVLYLLHGFPGRPAAFLQTVRVAIAEDVLLARGTGKPMILVMPAGSTGTFVDKEWADGVGRNQRWETWVAHDLVRWTDTRFRTIRSSRGRGIAGLSEGGYAALNITLHHPGEFGLAESWSGYEKAYDSRAIFAGRRALLRRNTPLVELPLAAPALRAHKVRFWMYSGRRDTLLAQNVAFAAELRRQGLAVRFREVPGGHDWSLWRGQVGRALLAASHGLAGQMGIGVSAPAAAHGGTPGRAA